jgi:hypothetical protein
MKPRIEVEFNVAMNNDEKKAGNVETVKFALIFPEGCEDQVQADAVAHAVVKFQSQIRSNWDKFVKDGVPEEVTYGDALYTKTRTRKPTEADIISYVQQLTQEGLMWMATNGKVPSKDEYPEFYKSEAN